MNELFRFLLLSNAALLGVLLSYKLLLQRNTFHALNRAYLLLGSVLAVLLPLLPFHTSSTAALFSIQLPALTVGGQSATNTSNWLLANWPLVVYAAGVLVALALFVRAIRTMHRLLRQAKTEVVQGKRVLRSDKAGPFSFLGIIHLPSTLSPNHQQTIFAHELAHVQLRHSYDVLWLTALRIAFWFNPLVKLYLQALQEIHEYQADARSHTSTSKEQYVKVQLDQLFQLPSDLSFANSFYNSINLKKRVNMIYSEKSSKWANFRYLIAIPLLAAIGFLSACTKTAAEEAQDDTGVYQEVDVMPEFPGGMAELANFLGATIKYPKAAEAEGIEGRVYVQFIVDEHGQVLKAIPTNSVREDIDKEAVRAVLEMPKWKPGKKDGKPVSVEMTLPIVFKLN